MSNSNFLNGGGNDVEVEMRSLITVISFSVVQERSTACNGKKRKFRWNYTYQIFILLFQISNPLWKGIIKLCSKSWMSSRFRKCCAPPIFRKEIMWKCIHLNFFRHHYALFAIQNRTSGHFKLVYLYTYFTFVRRRRRMINYYSK